MKFLSLFGLLPGLLGVVQLKLQLVLFPGWLPLVALFVQVCGELVFGSEELLIVVLLKELIFWQ